MTEIALSPGIFAFLSDTLSVGERVYPENLPQGVTLPAMTYQSVDVELLLEHQLQQDHPLYDGSIYKTSRIQFDAYGDTVDDVEALDNELMTAITGYRGLWGVVQIKSVIPAVTGIDFNDSDVGKRRRISDYFISWIGGADSGS